MIDCDFTRTLILKPSSMGDIVQALPVLTALREGRPEARVWWMAAKPFTGLLEDHPRLEGVIPFDRKRYAQAWWNPAAMRDLTRFLRDLRRREFTLVLDLQGLLRTGLFARLCGARTRVGFAAARELAPIFYTHRVVVPRADMHSVDRYLLVARAVGLSAPRATDHLPVTAAARARARQMLAEGGLARGESFVVVGADARWASKLWPAERYARVIDRVRAETGGRAVLVGGPGGQAVAGRIREAAAETPLDLVGRTTLKELVGLIAEARVMVTNDSGPMHIAAAVGTPAVAIFGPTSPDRTGPYGPGHRIMKTDVPCRPCYKRQCVLGGTEALACMAGVTADEVAEAVIDTWRRRAPGR
jgi:lipopolysaccharide heptosyltransferase I